MSNFSSEQPSPLIIGRRRVEFDLNESALEPIKSDEPLPAEYQQLWDQVQALSLIPTFTRQAREVIYRWWALDTHRALVGDQGQSVELTSFADLVASLPVIRLVFYRRTQLPAASTQPPQPHPNTKGPIIERRVVSMGNPLTSFPDWILDRVPATSLANQLETNSALQVVYRNWVRSYANQEFKETNGVYAEYPKQFSPSKSQQWDGFFKGYVEGNTDNLIDVLRVLADRGLHPHQTKLFEGSRLVLYWSTDLTPELTFDLQSIFQHHQVPFRGPAQDSLCLVRKHTGEIETSIRASNDQALGEGGKALDFAQSVFNPTVFLARYLQQCYRYWRNPLHPYHLSYVPAFDLTHSGEVTQLLALQSQLNQELIVMPGWTPKLFPDLP
jgi:hypothetical protein